MDLKITNILKEYGCDYIFYRVNKKIEVICLKHLKTKL